MCHGALTFYIKPIKYILRVVKSHRWCCLSAYNALLLYFKFFSFGYFSNVSRMEMKCTNNDRNNDVIIR